MLNTRIMFLRDSQYRPIGCVAITLDKRNHRLHYQCSVLHPNDKFDRKVARQLAIGRLVENPISVPLTRSEEVNMHAISYCVMQSITKSGAPMRAKKAAKIWLTEQDFMWATDAL